MIICFHISYSAPKVSCAYVILPGSLVASQLTLFGGSGWRAHSWDGSHTNHDTGLSTRRSQDTRGGASVFDEVILVVIHAGHGY